MWAGGAQLAVFLAHLGMKLLHDCRAGVLSHHCMSYHHNWEHVCLQELGMATPEGATTAGDGGQTPAWYDVAAAMMQQQGWPAAAGAPTAGMYAQLQQGGVQSQQQQQQQAEGGPQQQQAQQAPEPPAKTPEEEAAERAAAEQQRREEDAVLAQAKRIREVLSAAKVRPGLPYMPLQACTCWWRWPQCGAATRVHAVVCANKCHSPGWVPPAQALRAAPLLSSAGAALPRAQARQDALGLRARGDGGGCLRLPCWLRSCAN